MIYSEFISLHAQGLCDFAKMRAVLVRDYQPEAGHDLVTIGEHEIAAGKYAAGGLKTAGRWQGAELQIDPIDWSACDVETNHANGVVLIVDTAAGELPMAHVQLNAEGAGGEGRKFLRTTEFPAGVLEMRGA